MSYAVGSVIERIIDIVKQKAMEMYARSRGAVAKGGETIVKARKAMFSDESFAKTVLAAIVRIHLLLSREEKVVCMFRKIGSGVQRFQSSLEDSLSALSLLLEFLLALSIVLILVIAHWT